MGYHRNYGNTNKARRSLGRQDDDVQTDQGYRGSSQRKINKQGYPTIGNGSERISSTQASNLPEDDSFDDAPVDDGVTIKKGAILPVKNHILVSEELITEIDRAIQTNSKFSNLKMTPTDCMLNNSMISSELIKVVVMDEDTIILNHDLMGKQGTLIFEVSEIGFKVGCGNVKGNKPLVRAGPKEVLI